MQLGLLIVKEKKFANALRLFARRDIYGGLTKTRVFTD